MQTEDDEAIRFTCEACGHGGRVPAKFAGQRIKCPKCGAAVAVPAADEKRIRMTCTACGFRARLPERYLGLTVRCPNCSEPQVVGVELEPPAAETVQPIVPSTGETQLYRRAPVPKPEFDAAPAAPEPIPEPLAAPAAPEPIPIDESGGHDVLDTKVDAVADEPTGPDLDAIIDLVPDTEQCQPFAYTVEVFRDALLRMQDARSTLSSEVLTENDRISGLGVTAGNALKLLDAAEANLELTLENFVQGLRQFDQEVIDRRAMKKLTGDCRKQYLQEVTAFNKVLAALRGEAPDNGMNTTRSSPLLDDN